MSPALHTPCGHFVRIFTRFLRTAALTAPVHFRCHGVLIRRRRTQEDGGSNADGPRATYPELHKTRLGILESGERMESEMQAEQSNRGNPFGMEIHAYSREQALDDGTLVDVTSAAREAGFKLPVALTRAAWLDAVTWSERDSQMQMPQVEGGRLWDVVWMASLAARRSRCSSTVAFQLYRVPRDGKETRPRLITLHMHLTPGDAGEPVVTITLPHED